MGYKVQVATKEIAVRIYIKWNRHRSPGIYGHKGIHTGVFDRTEGSEQEASHYSFIPKISCTFRDCLILRSSMISSLPPGIA